MGLDMYAYVRREQDSDDEYDKEFAYWRKFNALHGWMENLYRERSGNDTFNCVNLPLTIRDLDRLEDDLNNNNLKPIEGFFFGPQEIDPEDIKDTHEFISAGKMFIEDGKEIYYSSWW